MSDVAWWEDVTVKFMLIQEDNDKNVYVWLIDDQYHVRAYNLDIDSWDASKVEFVFISELIYSQKI